MPSTIVIFGASGDLTSRKLIPALFSLARKERLPPGTRIVGVARTKFSHDDWRKDLAATTQKFAEKEWDAAAWQQFASALFYHPGDIGQAADFTALAKLLDEIEQGRQSTRLYYLSTAPQLYEQAVAQLGAAGLADEAQGPRRVIIEKPFGTDLASAQHLNAAVHKVFAERQVYRIDHYLGKETVQNMLVLRFANSIFEPVWNRRYIDHVQITAAEEVTVGHRGGYYDKSGVLRDMFQNHLLQLLAMTAMECPAHYQADAVRDEKVKVLAAIRQMQPDEVVRNTLRGQYRGYTQEKDVPGDSQTATFAVAKLCVENWRWQGVPFYLRSGKAMSCRTSQIVIQFNAPPLMLFPGGPRGIQGGNRLVVQVQPAEGIQLLFQTKIPDAGMKLRQTDLDFSFQREFHGVMPEAYERLLLDAMQGDPGLFARADEVETAWGVIDPILKTWQERHEPKLCTYEPGLWGPEESTQWMQAQGREWFDTCPVLH
ncbi:MAG TPA: glucose-6-phosphate dehydrogenase [Pirellulales bacterium]|jgi:glucose-6-phosphate 1-dehydrogenase|nr:glucose-6-phosphate dehydrogenase [Pirellulales bacterium]